MRQPAHLARLVHLVEVEVAVPAGGRRALVTLLRLVAEDEDDLAVEVESFELPVPDGRGLDPVSGERELARERAGAGHAERDPRISRHAFERVALLEGDARGAAQAGGAQAAALHLVRREHGHVAREPGGEVGRRGIGRVRRAQGGREPRERRPTP